MRFNISNLPRFSATATRLAIAALLWLVGISGLHCWLNTDSSQRQVVRMGYMPVVTNLASPLLDHASREGTGIRFHAIKFASFAEMAEALRNDDIHAAFMIAPLSIVLKQQQEKVRVVYIGNRHESTLVVRKNLQARSLNDLRGRTLAIPMRYSGHNLSILLLLEQAGLNGQINIVEMNPPDMPAALASGALDAYYVGEPYAAKSLLNGNASLLYYVEDVWKDFICNLVVVKQDMIDRQPKLVQALVHGAVRSGIWAQRHTEKAAAVAAEYWNQPQELVNYALNAPEGRIVYNRYTPHEKELQQIADLMWKFGLTTSNNIRGLVDNRFAKSADLSGITNIASILNPPALATDQNCFPKKVTVATIAANTPPDAFSN